MSAVDQALIDQVVRRVVAILQGRSAAPQSGPTPPPAPATPPAVEPKPPAPRIFVTADVLQQRVSANGRGSLVELAPNERLTPAAADLAEARHIAVRTLPQEPAAPPARPNPNGSRALPCGATAKTPSAAAKADPAMLPASPASSAVGLVVEKAAPSVNSAVRALSYDGLSLVDYTQTDCWMANLESLCNAVASGQARAGVAILPFAADAMVLAGKMRGIRPVQGTRLESVSAALRRFDANLVIIEHSVSTFHEIRSMVRLFAGRRSDTPTNAPLLDAVARLERT